MSVPEKHPVRLLLPGRHYVPVALAFEGLCLAEGEGVIRLQFSPKPGTTLDFPVTAKALSDLERTLRHLEGTPPEEMASEIARLSRDGTLPMKRA